MRVLIAVMALFFGLVGTGTVAAGSNFQGLWWNAQESGWGINLAHQGDTILATWFTFGIDGKPMWLVSAAAKTADSVYSGKLYTGTGPAFNSVPFDSGKVIATEVGTVTFTFADSTNATFAYTVNGISQTKQITRAQFGLVMPICAWGMQPDLAVATNYQDMWWAAPPYHESGWGINFAHQGDTIFATWFTFGLDGNPLWFAVGAGKIDTHIYGGTLYTVTGSPFNATPFDPSQVAGTPAGNATFDFSDGNNATFTYTMNGITQTKAITRYVFAPPGTVCHPQAGPDGSSDARPLQITGVSPPRAAVGDMITVIGTNFGEYARNASSVRLGRCPSDPKAPGPGLIDVPAQNIVSWSDTEIKVVLPSRSLGFVTVIRADGQMSNRWEFEVLFPCAISMTKTPCLA